MAKVCDSTDTVEIVDAPLITSVMENIGDIADGNSMLPNAQPESTVSPDEKADAASDTTNDLLAATVEGPVDANTQTQDQMIEDT